MGSLSKCAVCRSKRLHDGTAQESLDVQVTEGIAVRFVTDLPATVCADCDEHFYTAQALARFELAAAAYLGRMGHPAPGVIRFMRKALGLSGTKLASLLGVAQETVSRWENGKTNVPKSTLAILAMLAEEELGRPTAMRKVLSGLEQPAPFPTEPVEIAAA